MKKTIILSIVGIFTVVAVIIHITRPLSDNLTVSNIHANVVYGQTTVAELRKMYGKPIQIKYGEDAEDEYQVDIGDTDEGGTDDQLMDNTNYDETNRFKSGMIGKLSRAINASADTYLDYRGRYLGLEYVHFYAIHGIIVDSQLGGFTSDIAKSDYYLRQIYYE